MDFPKLDVDSDYRSEPTPVEWKLAEEGLQAARALWESTYSLKVCLNAAGRPWRCDLCGTIGISPSISLSVHANTFKTLGNFEKHFSKYLRLNVPAAPRVLFTLILPINFCWIEKEVKKPSCTIPYTTFVLLTAFLTTFLLKLEPLV